MSYTVDWKPSATARLSALAKDHPEAPDLIVAAVYDLPSNPRPTNSTQLGTSSIRRLLLGYWRVTYEVVEADQIIEILIVGRSNESR